MDNRLLTPESLKEDSFDNTIRPQTLQEYIDQISEIVNQFGADIADKLEPLIEKAQEEHDKLQTEYNKDAKSKASSGSASCKQV